MTRRPLTRSLVLVGLAAALAVAGGAGRAAPNTVFTGGSIGLVDCCNNVGAAIGNPSTAATYPSSITITPAQLSGNVGHVTVTVVLDAQWPDDVQLLLVNSNPPIKKVLLMANVGGGGGNAISPDTLTFDDSGVAIPDNGQLESGTYKPTAANDAGDCDNQANPADFPGSAPAGPYAGALSAFNGKLAAGTWKLYAIDDCNLANVGGSIVSWSLEITGPTAVTLKSFTARREARGVQLRWQTASETDALGFNVYRFSAGGKAKVNHGLVAAKRRGTPRGAAYSLRDSRARRGTPYTYRLQVVGLHGTRSWAATSTVRARR